jgi:hypothetical protein
MESVMTATFVLMLTESTQASAPIRASRISSLRVLVGVWLKVHLKSALK